jgi:diguanylate cyclase (GGDEF)-like protein
MPSISRSASVRRNGQARTRSDATLYRSTRSDKRTSKPKRASISLTAVGPDFAARLRAAQRVLRSRVGKHSALLDVVRAVNTTLEPEKLAELIVDRGATWIPAPIWALVSSDLSGDLTVLAGRGLTEEMGDAVDAVATWVMHHGDEFTSPDLRADARVSAQLASAVLALPLISRGTRIGALVALDRKPSSRDPKLAPSLLRAILLLLEPAAAALDAALQLKRAEALSVTDDLTHLYNSRYLNQVLRRETKRATRSGRPLSLLFLDLDGFKSINDSHGHLCGSRALVEAAGVVRDSARETDIVARFGGDEFALILPDTGREGAFAVGERVRQRIAAHSFLASDGLDIHLTASVGVATLPDVASTPDGLMQAADVAMYRVKQSGKNGIQAATTPADN